MVLISKYWARRLLDELKENLFFRKNFPPHRECRLTREGISAEDPIDMEEETLRNLQPGPIIYHRWDPVGAYIERGTPVAASCVTFYPDMGIRVPEFQPAYDIAGESPGRFEAQVRASAKAYALLLDVLGEKDYQSFLRDGYLEIVGKHGTYILTVGGRIYRIVGNEARLLCIGPDENCPVMDKICSLYLMIKEDEKAVIKEANVTSTESKDRLLKLIKEGL